MAMVYDQQIYQSHKPAIVAASCELLGRETDWQKPPGF